MTQLTIKKLYKQESFKIKQLLNNCQFITPEQKTKKLQFKFYYKDRDLTPVNKKFTIFLDTIISTLTFRAKVSNKDFDLYTKLPILWQCITLTDYNTMSIGKHCIFNKSQNQNYPNTEIQHFWDDLLIKMQNPIDRFKFLFHHQIGHFVQKIYGHNYCLHTLNEEQNSIINTEVSQYLNSNKAVQYTIAQTYADCFSIYMLSQENKAQLHTLIALVMNARIKQQQNKTADHNSANLCCFEMSYIFTQFSQLSLDTDNLEIVHTSIMQCITNAILNMFYFQYLEDNNQTFECLKFINQVDKEKNNHKFNNYKSIKQKINDKDGLMNLLQHNLLTEYNETDANVLSQKHLANLFVDIEAQQFILNNAAHIIENNNFLLNNYEQTLLQKQGNSVLNLLSRAINKIYYFPRQGWYFSQ